jgi:hypothetical protein
MRWHDVLGHISPYKTMAADLRAEYSALEQPGHVDDSNGGLLLAGIQSRKGHIHC